MKRPWNTIIIIKYNKIIIIIIIITIQLLLLNTNDKIRNLS